MSIDAVLSIPDVSLGASHVREPRFVHELGRPWRVHLELGSTDPDLDLERIVGARPGSRYRTSP